MKWTPHPGWDINTTYAVIQHWPWHILNHFPYTLMYKFSFIKKAIISCIAHFQWWHIFIALMFNISLRFSIQMYSKFNRFSACHCTSENESDSLGFINTYDKDWIKIRVKGQIVGPGTCGRRLGIDSSQKYILNKWKLIY